MKTVRLLIWSAIAYAIILVLAWGSLPTDSTPTIALTGIPLAVIAIIISRNLSQRSTNPTVRMVDATRPLPKENPVRFLSGQISIAVSASDSYFENVVRARLRELLILKVALETGLEHDTVRQALSDPKRGPALLHNTTLYEVLYGPIPDAWERIEMIDDAVDLIGAWKG